MGVKGERWCLFRDGRIIRIPDKVVEDYRRKGQVFEHQRDVVRCLIGDQETVLATLQAERKSLSLQART